MISQRQHMIRNRNKALCVSGTQSFFDLLKTEYVPPIHCDNCVRISPKRHGVTRVKEIILLGPPIAPAGPTRTYLHPRWRGAVLGHVSQHRTPPRPRKLGGPVRARDAESARISFHDVALLHCYCDRVAAKQGKSDSVCEPILKIGIAVGDKTTGIGCWSGWCAGAASGDWQSGEGQLIIPEKVTRRFSEFSRAGVSFCPSLADSNLSFDVRATVC